VFIPKEAIKCFLTSMDANGVKTIMTSEYREDNPLPLVEIYFKVLDSNGAIKPLPLDSANLYSNVNGGNFKLDGGIALRLAVGKDKRNIRNLIRGTRYSVPECKLPGKSQWLTCITPEDKRSFVVPENLSSDQIYRVDLLLRDEALEEKATAQEKPVDYRIHIRLTDPNIVPSDGSIQVSYNDGKKDESSIITGDRCTVQGQTLGGELLVQRSQRIRDKYYRVRPWVYIDHVTKRELVLPDDGDLVIEPNDLTKIEVRFRGAKDMENLNVLWLLTKKHGQLGLFLGGCKPSKKDGADQEWIGYIEAMPGQYWLGGVDLKGQRVWFDKMLEVKPGVTSYQVDLEDG